MEKEEEEEKEEKEKETEWETKWFTRKDCKIKERVRNKKKFDIYS